MPNFNDLFASQKVDEQIESISEQKDQIAPEIHSNVIPTTGKTYRKRLGMVAAVIFIALLVGSMAIVFNAAHDRAGSSSFGSVKIGPAPTMLQVTRTSSISKNRILQSWTVTNVQAVQHLYDAIYALPASPTLHPTPCPMTDRYSQYQLSFFHQKTLIQRVLVPGGCGGLVVIGVKDIRMWNPQFGALFAKTIGITTPLPL